MNFALPDFLVLAWAGLAAALCFAWIRPVASEGRAFLRFLGALLLALVFYTPLYGLLFETIHRADVLSGLLAGTMHGVAALFAGAPRNAPARTRTATRARVVLAHIVFGAVLGSLYVVPAA